MDDFENKDRGFNGAEQEDGTTRIDMPRRHRREEAPEDARSGKSGTWRAG